MYLELSYISKYQINIHHIDLVFNKYISKSAITSQWNWNVPMLTNLLGQVSCGDHYSSGITSFILSIVSTAPWVRTLFEMCRANQWINFLFVMISRFCRLNLRDISSEPKRWNKCGYSVMPMGDLKDLTIIQRLKSWNCNQTGSDSDLLKGWDWDLRQYGITVIILFL